MTAEPRRCCAAAFPIPGREPPRPPRRLGRDPVLDTETALAATTTIFPRRCWICCAGTSGRRPAGRRRPPGRAWRRAPRRPARVDDGAAARAGRADAARAAAPAAQPGADPGARAGPRRTCRRSPASTPRSTAPCRAVAARFALPRELEREGVRRYGFHGLSYEYIAGGCARSTPDLAAGRVIVAHLGNGASLCAHARRPQRRHHHGLHAARRAGDGHALRRARSRRGALPAAAERPDAPSRSRTCSITAPACSACPALAPTCATAGRSDDPAAREARRPVRLPHRPRDRRRWPRRSAGSTRWSSPPASASTPPGSARAPARGWAGSASPSTRRRTRAAPAASAPPTAGSRCWSSRPTRKP